MDIAEQLRDALSKSELSPYAIGKSAGVDTSQISRFITRERDLTLFTAAKLAAALGLELRPVAQRRGRSTREK